MKRFKINTKTRNEFFYQTIYGLFYPAALGAILVYVMQDTLTGKLFHNGIFPLLTLICLIWYFVLDFYIGLTNFKGDEKDYDSRYLFCDIIFVISAFVAYYGLWMTTINMEFLVFISYTIITVLLIVLDYFDAKDAEIEFDIKNAYSISMLTLSFLSMGMTVLSLTLSESIFYLISKNLFILLTGIVLILYTFYIMSDDSFKIE